MGHPLSYRSLGLPSSDNTTQLVWGHGWMHTHSALAPLADFFSRKYSNILLDFPGFGSSPMPSSVWGTRQYADHVASWLQTVPKQSRVWVGHSFGCRVGIQLAAHYPELIDGLFLIGAAGLPIKRSILGSAKIKSKIFTYKLLKRIVPTTALREKLGAYFGSRDYATAGPMRPIFSAVIREDLSDVAKTVECPVFLVYGEMDTETPVSMGDAFSKLFRRATLVRLPHFGHVDILSDGMHQLRHHLLHFMKECSL